MSLALLATAALVAALAGDAKPITPTAAAAPPVPDADFARLCSGHITAVPNPDGSPGPHLEWIAYSSTEPVEKLAKRHAKLLAAASHEEQESCHLWRFEDTGRHIWDLCPVEIPGPTSGCDAPPRGTRSILLVSTMIGGK